MMAATYGDGFKAGLKEAARIARAYADRCFDMTESAIAERIAELIEEELKA